MFMYFNYFECILSVFQIQNGGQCIQYFGHYRQFIKTWNVGVGEWLFDDKIRQNWRTLFRSSLLPVYGYVISKYVCNSLCGNSRFFCHPYFTWNQFGDIHFVLILQIVFNWRKWSSRPSWSMNLSKTSKFYKPHSKKWALTR